MAIVAASSKLSKIQDQSLRGQCSPTLREKKLPLRHHMAR